MGGKDIPGVNMLSLVKSVASVERGCTRTGVCSGAGACGMMQFIRASAVAYAPQCGAGGSFAVGGSGDETAPGYVPSSDACGGNPANLCRANYPNTRCDAGKAARCNSPEYQALFQSGLSLYYQHGGKDIPGVNIG